MCNAYKLMMYSLYCRLQCIYSGFGRCGSQRFAWWHYGVYKFYLSCGFQQDDNIWITSSTCRHCTLSNSVMCSDSYPIPILSFFFLYHPYIPYFLIQRIFHFLVSFLFLLHACMYSHQVHHSNVGLAPRIRLSTWTKLDGYSYSYLPCY